jgi:hypothetical protein
MHSFARACRYRRMRASDLISFSMAR